MQTQRTEAGLQNEKMFKLMMAVQFVLALYYLWRCNVPAMAGFSGCIFSTWKLLCCSRDVEEISLRLRNLQQYMQGLKNSF